MASVRSYSQFRERNRNAHLAIRGLESQWESPVLSPAFDSGRCSVAVMQPTESRQGNDLASDRGCRGRNSTAGSVLTESEVGPIFVIQGDNATPIVLNREKSVTLGILGTTVW